MRREVTSENAVWAAIDIGGTFTDVVIADAAGELSTAKVLSSPPDLGRAVIDGLCQALRSHRVSAAAIRAVLHGMTVATNAVIEGRGASTALVTTKGFRDVLEFTTGRRPQQYDLLWQKPKPLVPRRLRFELDQRITSRGELAPAAQADELCALAARLQRAGIRSVAVCLINSHIRPDEERRVVEVLAAHARELLFTASVDLSPEPGEYERTSTAVVNAYVRPVVDSYLTRLEGGLRDLGVAAPFYVMQSSGGLLGVRSARERPVQLIESGPAAGVTATQVLARHIDRKELIAFDMGGTTAKASLIERGEPFHSAEYEVGGGMNANPGYSSGAGYLVRAPSLDIAEVGAGGGSVMWVDRAGSPHVGPRSAGAAPGPACYGRGGTEPTLSDACVVLGYFNPVEIAGGAQRIDADLARAAVRGVADILGLDPIAAAFGAVRIATANMTSMVRAVTTQRGRDPRDYALVAFGGCGPAYAVGLARELGIDTVIVPPAPGLWSAVGLVVSDPRHELVRYLVSSRPDVGAIAAAFTAMEAELSEMLAADGHAIDQIRFERHADVRYHGQKGSLRVTVEAGPFSERSLNDVLQHHEDEHRRTYGHAKARNVAEIPTVRVRASVPGAGADALRALRGRVLTSAAATFRQAYFGPDVGVCSTDIIRRGDLNASARGPLIIEELDSTVVVPPWAQARLDELGNVVVTVEALEDR